MNHFQFQLILKSLIDKRPFKHVKIFWKPSEPTCGFATHIGLAIRMKLDKELNLSEKIKFDLFIKAGGHRQYKMSKFLTLVLITNKNIVNKQINDKERIAAARENEELMSFLESLIS